MDNATNDLMVLCGWCNKLLRMGRGPVSHGICTACANEHFPGIPIPVIEPDGSEAVAR